MNGFKELLQPYIDGQLGELDRILLEEHLKFCFSCQRELNQYIVLDWYLKGIKEKIEVPEELSQLRAEVINYYFKDMDLGGKITVGDFAKIQYTAWKNVFNGAYYLPGRKVVQSFMLYTGRTLEKTAKRSLRSLRFWPV